MIYAASDLHGFPLESFLQFLRYAGFADRDTLYILGDVIDRNGDGGIALLQWIMKTPNVRLIMGNHEKMMLDCEYFLVENCKMNTDAEELAEHLFQWLHNGAYTTISTLRRCDQKTISSLYAFLKKLPLYAEVRANEKDYILVHSGLGHFDPERKLSDYFADDLVWYRPGIDERYFENKTVIFGHTPTAVYEQEKHGTKPCPGKDALFRTDTWIDIDTGAASPSRAPMLLRLDDMKPFYYWEMKEQDREDKP